MLLKEILIDEKNIGSFRFLAPKCFMFTSKTTVFIGELRQPTNLAKTLDNEILSFSLLPDQLRDGFHYFWVMVDDISLRKFRYKVQIIEGHSLLEVDKEYNQILFPPPKTKALKQVLFVEFLKKFLILNEIGSIFIVETQKNQSCCNIERSIEWTLLLNKQQKKLDKIPTILRVFKCSLPNGNFFNKAKLESILKAASQEQSQKEKEEWKDTRSDNLDLLIENIKSSGSEKEAKIKDLLLTAAGISLNPGKEEEYVMIGYDDGTIGFHSFDDILTACFEFTFHRTPVQNAMMAQFKSLSLLVSICSERVLNITEISHKELRILYRFEGAGIIRTPFEWAQDSLVLALENGMVAFFELQSDERLVYKASDLLKRGNHSGQIEIIKKVGGEKEPQGIKSGLEENPIIVSLCSNNEMIFWGKGRNELRKIEFQEKIDSVEVLAIESLVIYTSKKSIHSFTVNFRALSQKERELSEEENLKFLKEKKKPKKTEITHFFKTGKKPLALGLLPKIAGFILSKKNDEDGKRGKVEKVKRSGSFSIRTKTRRAPELGDFNMRKINIEMRRKELERLQEEQESENDFDLNYFMNDPPIAKPFKLDHFDPKPNSKRPSDCPSIAGTQRTTDRKPSIGTKGEPNPALVSFDKIAHLPFDNLKRRSVDFSSFSSSESAVELQKRFQEELENPKGYLAFSAAVNKVIDPKNEKNMNNFQVKFPKKNNKAIDKTLESFEELMRRKEALEKKRDECRARIFTQKPVKARATSLKKPGKEKKEPLDGFDYAQEAIRREMSFEEKRQKLEAMERHDVKVNKPKLIKDICVMRSERMEKLLEKKSLKKVQKPKKAKEPFNYDVIMGQNLITIAKSRLKKH